MQERKQIDYGKWEDGYGIPTTGLKVVDKLPKFICPIVQVKKKMYVHGTSEHDKNSDMEIATDGQITIKANIRQYQGMIEDVWVSYIAEPDDENTQKQIRELETQMQKMKDDYTAELKKMREEIEALKNARTERDPGDEGKKSGNIERQKEGETYGETYGEPDPESNDVAVLTAGLNFHMAAMGKISAKLNEIQKIQ